MGYPGPTMTKNGHIHGKHDGSRMDVEISHGFP